MKIKMTEQQLVNQILGYLNYKGYYCYRQNSGVSRSEYTDKKGITKTRMWRSGIKGIADIVGISPKGKYVAIECKIEPNKPTLLQKLFLDEVRQRGGIAMVIYSLEDLEKQLKEVI